MHHLCILEPQGTRTSRNKNLKEQEPQGTRTSRNKNNLFEWLLVWEILCFSGQGQASGFRFVPGNLMAAILFVTSSYLFMRKPKLKADSSTATMLIIASWLSFNTLFVTILGSGAPKGLGLDLQSKVIAVSMYLAISTFSFRQFREKMLKALTILSAVTMIVWVLHITLRIGKFGRWPAHTFYIFMDWGGRMASIYWEPGMYQIIIMFVLCLFYDEFTAISLRNFMYYVRKFGIVILALIVSQSTMGYLCLMLLLGISFMFNKTVKKNKILYVLLLVAALSCAVIIWNTDVVQKKIDLDKLLVGGSMSTRLIDNLALLNMSMIHPITGLGLGSKDAIRYAHIFGDVTGSNGWFYLSAHYGWPFFVFIIMCILKNLRRMKSGIPAWLMFIPLFASQSDEFYALFPIMYMYLYKYKDYS